MGWICPGTLGDNTPKWCIVLEIPLEFFWTGLSQMNAFRDLGLSSRGESTLSKDRMQRILPP